MELLVTPDSSPWGTGAKFGSQQLTFSGTFDSGRIALERTKSVYRKTETVALWLLIALGAMGLTVTSFFAFEARTISYFTAQSWGSLFFWAGVLAVLYSWARSVHDHRNSERINLLGENEAASVDVFELFDPAAKAAWNKAGTGATLDTLFTSLCASPEVSLAFARLGVKAADVQTIVENYNRLNPATEHPGLGEVPFGAYQTARRLHSKSISPLVLLVAAVAAAPARHIISSVALNLDLDAERLETLAAWELNLVTMVDDLKTFTHFAKHKSDSEVNRGLTSVPTPYLDRFSEDLTNYAKYGRLPLALGRGGDVSSLFALLSEGRSRVVIKGAPGTGRTTLVNEIAYKMAEEQVPSQLSDKRLVRLEIGSIVGTSGKAEATLLGCLRDAEKSGSIVLVVEDIHQLAEAHTEGGLNLLETFVSQISGSNIPVIATTTPEEFSGSLTKTPNFEQMFTGYELQPLSERAVTLACCIRCSVLESSKGVFFTFPAVEQAVALSNSYIRGGGQPEKAIAILTEAASRAKGAERKNIVDEELVQLVISEKTHIPTASFSEDEAQKLLKLEEVLATQVVGQKAAVAAVAEGLRRARSGLVEGARPLASFLFLGPTGVGKTEIARALSTHYFGKAEYLLRLDMSEYHGADALQKLLGSPGQKADSALVSHLKTYPFCLLLCDEFEKASTEVHNIFLQVLEDGRLTSGQGETLDLSHAVVIATSNAGAREIQSGIRTGKTLEQIKTELWNGPLLQVLAPELLNRFDGVIVFTPLSPEEVQQITLLQLHHLEQQLLEKGMKVRFTEAVAADVAKNAYDPSFGARPIRRYIQDHVEGYVAKLLLSKELRKGTEVTVDVGEGGYTLVSE